jgi:hypothetical protein
MPSAQNGKDFSLQQDIKQPLRWCNQTTVLTLGAFWNRGQNSPNGTIRRFVNLFQTRLFECDVEFCFCLPKPLPRQYVLAFNKVIYTREARENRQEFYGQFLAIWRPTHQHDSSDSEDSNVLNPILLESLRLKSKICMDQTTNGSYHPSPMILNWKLLWM